MKCKFSKQCLHYRNDSFTCHTYNASGRKFSLFEFILIGRWKKGYCGYYRQFLINKESKENEKNTNWNEYTNWNKILEQSKKWPVNEQLRFFNWKKQGLTGKISKNGSWYITKKDWERFKTGKEPTNEYNENVIA
jgi:hypothetical protein